VRPIVPMPIARGARGAVVAPHSLAVEAGISILRSGGNAVDAAVAANAVLSVVQPQSCGLGGDAFWLISEGTGGQWPSPPGGRRIWALNGSGRSAAGASIEAYWSRGVAEMPADGALTITVPGAVASWGDALERYGALGFARDLEPAIELADGFPATDIWSARVEAMELEFAGTGNWQSTFRPHGRSWRPGEIVRVPAMARTLRRLAEGGAQSFYEGELAAEQSRFLQEAGSLITFDDLARHRSDWTEPISTTYRGVVATTHPPNSAGIHALESLNILGHFDPPDRAAFGLQGTDARWTHLGIETAKFALEDRDRYLTDPDRMEPGVVEMLLGGRHAADLASRIDPRRARRPVIAARDGGTIYLATTDRWGGAVSLIASNWSSLGSGLVNPAHGFAYQNRGAFFSLDPRHANALGPGKRTLHTLIPGMLLRDGSPWIVHGSMGGNIQLQIYAQFVSAVVDGGLGIESAVAAPRWGVNPSEILGPPDLTIMEPGYSQSVRAELEELGHSLVLTEAFSSELGFCHAIEIQRFDGGAIQSFKAVTDPRSDGLPGAF